MVSTDMNNDTLENLEYLARRMKRQQPILFTGAGFSYEAKNVHGQELPLGEGLKKLMLDEFLCLDPTSDEYGDWCKTTLADVYEYAVSRQGIEKSVAFVRNIFSDCVPEDFQKVIANYPWSKIYTLNIDDLMENAAPQGRFNVVNSRNNGYKTAHKAIDYIKLHGCVRNYSEGFIFSNSDYTQSVSGYQDCRFANLVSDMQTSDFVFLGTANDERDVDYYLTRFGYSPGTPQGGFFFVCYKPNAVIKNKILSKGAHLLDMTCREFAEWLDSQADSTKVTARTIGKANFDKNFLYVNRLFKAKVNIQNFKSNLYFGEDPEWLDIFKDWDFKSPVTERIFDTIDQVSKSSSENSVISITGKALGGKSVLLKRIGYELIARGYEVLEFTGFTFNIKSFKEYASSLPGQDIALLVDRGSYHYNLITSLAEEFPADKHLVIVTVDRPYFHFKKHYELSQLPGYSHFEIDDLSIEERTEIAKSAVETLDDKNFLGKLKGKSREEQIKFFIKGDIAESLWNLTRGSNFRRKLLDSYNKIHKIHTAETDLTSHIDDVLCLLAIFDKADLPFVPNQLLIIWKPSRCKRIYESISDFIKRVGSDGVSLRTNILVDVILSRTPKADLRRVLKEALEVIAPLRRTPEHYWNQIQSRILKVGFLENILKIFPEKIYELFNKIGKSYSNDPHYYIQLALVEQRLDQYERALNHLHQAENFLPGAYIIRNAIARNFLRVASRKKSITQLEADDSYRLGREQMLKLINDKEQFQIRAYSVHSLVKESISYWERFRITPGKEEVEELIECIGIVINKAPDDPKIQDTQASLVRFLKKRNLTKLLPKLQLNNLSIVKALFKDDFGKDYLLDDNPDF